MSNKVNENKISDIANRKLKTFNDDGDRICNVKNCKRYYVAKGLCVHHREELKNNGTLTFGNEINKPSSHYLYSTWQGMKQRCLNPKNKAYKNYGGRKKGSIKVCNRWVNSFDKFVKDIESLGEKPTPNHSLDRIDNNGDYEISNVRWACKKVQSRNQRSRKNSVSGQKGVIYVDCRYKWKASICIDNKSKHLGYYEYLEDAINARLEAEKTYW